jgi:hypothetical protein
MWITRTSKYVWVLTSNGTFSKSNCYGITTTRGSKPSTTPSRDEEVVLINGINNSSEEVVGYARMQPGSSDPYSGRYEIYIVSMDYWQTVSQNMFFKFTNLAHIRNTQKQLAKEILLGQT